MIVVEQSVVCKLVFFATLGKSLQLGWYRARPLPPVLWECCPSTVARNKDELYLTVPPITKIFCKIPSDTHM